jgi:hypothetical protein
MQRSSAFAVLALLVGVSEASAQAINRRNTGVSSPSYTLDFNGLAAGTVPGTIAGVNFAGAWTASTPGSCGGAFSTMSLYNFGCPGNPLTHPVSVFFTKVVYGAAFNMITNQTNSIFNAYLGNTLVASFSGLTNLTTPEQFWYGFQGIAFNRIELNAAATNGSIGIDNLQVVATPEPATVGLLATGLVALAGAGYVRRRRTKV